MGHRQSLRQYSGAVDSALLEEHQHRMGRGEHRLLELRRKFPGAETAHGAELFVRASWRECRCIQYPVAGSNERKRSYRIARQTRHAAKSLSHAAARTPWRRGGSSDCLREPVSLTALLRTCERSKVHDCSVSIDGVPSPLYFSSRFSPGQINRRFSTTLGGSICGGAFSWSFSSWYHSACPCLPRAIRSSPIGRSRATRSRVGTCSVRRTGRPRMANWSAHPNLPRAVGSCWTSRCRMLRSDSTSRCRQAAKPESCCVR